MNLKENRVAYAAYFVAVTMIFVFAVNAAAILLGSHVAQVLPLSLLMFLLTKKLFFKGRKFTYIEPIYFCVILLVVGFIDYMMWFQKIETEIATLASLFIAFCLFTIRFRLL